MGAIFRVRGLVGRALLGVTIAGAGAVGVLLLFGGGAAVATPTCTLNFNNPAGGDYFTAANWNDAVTPTTHRVPAATDYACIPAATTGAVTFTTGVSSTILGIDAEGTGGFTVGSGTLTLTDTTNASTIKQLTLSGGTVAGGAAVSLSGSATWVRGTVSPTGGVTVSSTATVAVTDTGYYAFLGTTLTNHGTITVTNGGYLGLYFNTNGVLVNAADGTVDLQGDGADFIDNGSANSITNNGLIKHSTGTGTTTIGVSITTPLNKLTAGAGTGVLSLTGGGTLSGTATTPTGATLSFDSGTYTLNGATFAGTGTTQLTNATWALSATNTVSSAFTLNTGTINGAGDLTIAGSATWVRGTVSPTGGVTVSSTATVAVTDTGYYAFLGTTLTNHGTITVTNGGYLGLYFNTNGVLVNAADGTVDLQGDGADFIDNGSANSITNNGLIKHSTGTGTTTIGVSITTPLNKLTAGAGTGVLSLTGGGTLSGTATTPTGATLSFDSGTYTLNGATFAGTGTTQLTNATWALSATNTVSSAFTLNTGTINGAGDLTIAGSATWVRGTVSPTGGVTVSSTATVAVTDTGYYAFLGTTLTNHGTITVTNGGYLGLYFNTNGVLVNAADGTVDLQGDGADFIDNGSANSITNNGLIKHSTGTGTTTIGVSLTNSGELRIEAGTVTVPTLTNLATNTLTGGTYTITGTLQLTYGGTNKLLLTNAANITLNGATSALLNESSADSIGSLATNSGSLALTGSRALSTTASPFTNSGAVTVGDGANASSFTVNGQYVQTDGTTTVALGSTLTPTSSNASIQGGALNGAGTVTGPVVTGTNATVQNATGAGPLNLGNGYSGTGKVKAVITSASAFDRVNVTGTATLTGSKLTLSTAAGYHPPQGQTFTILTCSTACTGPFATVTGATMSDGAFYQITYAAKKVTLTAIRNADVSITNTDSSDPIPADAPNGPASSLTYTVTVTNAGPAPANGVVVTDTLPHHAIVTSLPASCSGAGDVKTCGLGTIAVGANVVLNFVVTPPSPETLTNTVSSTAVAGSPDPNGANNTNIAQTTVVTAQPHTSYVNVDNGAGGVSYDNPNLTLKKLGDKVQFNFWGTASHRLQSDEGILDTGVKAPGTEFAVAVTGSGVYSYHDTLAAQVVNGTITAKPKFTGTGTSRTVTWASAPPAAGYVFDVRVKTPTGTTVLVTGTTATSTVYTADQGPGNYQFQVRLRRSADNTATGYAKSKTFTI